MTREKKLRLRAIALYLVPIILTPLLTKNMHYSILSLGIMSIIIGLSFKYVPGFIGHEKGKNNNSSLFFVVAGFLILTIYLFYL